MTAQQQQQQQQQQQSIAVAVACLSACHVFNYNIHLSQIERRYEATWRQQQRRRHYINRRHPRRATTAQLLSAERSRTRQLVARNYIFSDGR